MPFYGFYNSGEFAFILEKFIDGPSLGTILKQDKGQPLELNQALQYFKAIASAIGYAHANGVIHCDIKPGNVMIDAGGGIYLTDFGIARHTESSNTTMGAAGTPGYMAPEQIRAEAVSPATDIYSLGVVLYEMFTGQRPFRGSEPGAETAGQTNAERIRFGHLHLSPADPCQINPSISHELGQAILKCLEKKPNARYESIRQLYEAVYSAIDYTETTRPSNDGRNMRPVPSTSQGAVLIEPDRLIGQPQASNQNKWSIWITAVICSLLLLFGASLFFRKPASNPVPPTANKQINSNLPATEVGNPPFVVAVPTQQPTDEPAPAPTDIPDPTATEPPLPSPTAAAFTKGLKDGATLVFIPEGEFIMGADPGSPYFSGAEGPAHKIYLSAYSIYLTEVTNAMYQACVKEKACPKPAKFNSRTVTDYYGNPQYANYPVIYVNWVSAQSYCVWAGGKLPSEAQWEKAARGDDERLFPWGDTPPAKDQVNLCDTHCAEPGNSGPLLDSYPDVAPVGMHPLDSSPYGVLDMAGNVHEWVIDWKDGYTSYEYKNPKGPASGSRRVFRGGSWIDFSPEELRTVVRASLNPNESFDTIGFRCVVNQ